MIHLLPCLKEKLPGFNERVFTADDFFEIAKREDIWFDVWPLPGGVHGFYGINRRPEIPVKCIVVNELLYPRGQWLHVALHELIHHFLHVPRANVQVFVSHCNDVTGRADREAEMFALMMRIPKPLLDEIMRPGSDEQYFHWTDDIRDRLAINERYGE